MKIAMRFIWRKKTYSLLNYLCLTFGLSCAIVAAIYILNVFSYDKFHKNYERLYAVDAYVTYFNGDRFPKEYLSASLAEKLKNNAPEIEKLTRVAERSFQFIIGEKEFVENGIFADSGFFDVFSFPVNTSGAEGILSDPNSAAISDRMAMKHFGTTECIGKTLIVRNEGATESYRVSAVFRDVPPQSYLQFDFVIPFEKFLSLNRSAMDPGATADETWIVLRNSSDRQRVEDKIKNLIRDQESTMNQELFLYPLKEKVLYSYAGGKRVWKEMQSVVIAGAIGLAILLIACFNFINIAIALNFNRYRETGIRKSAGAGRSAIVLQFLGETCIVTLLSLASAVIVVRLLLFAFNTMLKQHINPEFSGLGMIVFFIAITLFTVLVSGLVPALYLASLNPADALKGVRVKGAGFSGFRQSLIVFQFTIPVVLIVGMMIIRTQDRYMRDYDAGVDRDRVIIMNNSKSIQQHAESFRSDLLSIPGIEAVSFTNCIPTRGAKVSSDVSWDGKDPLQKLHFWCVNTDFEYNKTVQLRITEGRFFDPAFSTDSVSYMINDVAAGVMKTKSPLGSVISLDGKKGTVIGVFTGFHAIDLAGPYTPTIIRIGPADKSSIMIKYSGSSFHDISGRLQEVYKRYDQEHPYQAVLFRDLPSYSNLSLPSRIVGAAFVIALLLACLGLYGLASFTCENRKKEIAIRKANGASIPVLVGLLLKIYIRWLGIAIIIALPLAFLAGMVFLGRFYFHSPMPLWAFITGPATALSVALLTVIFKTRNAAAANPVLSLRNE